MQSKFTQKNLRVHFMKIFAATSIFLLATAHFSYAQFKITSSKQQLLKVSNNGNDVGRVSPERNTLTPSPNAVCATYTGALSATDATISVARMGRDGVASTCGAPKTCPGGLPGGAAGNSYDSYTFVNVSGISQCVTATLNNTGTTNQIFAAAYLGSFSPSNVCTNYLADAGSSPAAGASQSFSFTVPIGATVIIIVNSTTVGAFNSYTLSLDGLCAACVPVSFTTQPANASVVCGSSTTFKVVTVGDLPVYQWEYRATATSAWLNVVNGGVYSGANTATLSVTNAPASLTGYQYRVVVSGACSGLDFSAPATLTVTPLIATVSPASTTICTGSIQKLSITNTSPATVVTVNSAAALNITIPDNASTTGITSSLTVAGVPAGVSITSIRVKLNVTHSWVGDLVFVLKAPNGKILNLGYALTGTGGASGTTGLVNTIFASDGVAEFQSGKNPYTATFKADAFDPSTGDPTVPTGPDGFIPNVTTFGELYTAATSTTVNGLWTLALYDYYPDFQTTNKFNNWSIEVTYSAGLAKGVFTSPTTNTLYTDAAGTILYDGTTLINTVYAKPTATGVTSYSVIVNNGLCTTGSLTIPVTVNAPITDTRIIVGNASTCVGGTTFFTATAATGTGVSNQWKVSTDNGVTFTNVVNGGVYSGATTSKLTITGATITMNNYKYKDSLFVTACGSSIVSDVATLTVNPNPVVTISAPLTRLNPNLTTTITANVTPNPAATYTFFRNGVAVPNTTGNKLLVNVDNLGSYTVSVNDVNGCNGVSSELVISDTANSTLFIYPSPTSGPFQVRYFGLNPLAEVPGLINIYDSRGVRVLSKSYSVIRNAYTRLDVDLTNYSRGLYRVELIDSKGNRIKTGSVLVL